jgi:hypothetical protein
LSLRDNRGRLVVSDLDRARLADGETVRQLASFLDCRELLLDDAVLDDGKRGHPAGTISRPFQLFNPARRAAWEAALTA